MTDATSVRSSKSTKSTQDVTASGPFPHWQDDEFYSDQSQQNVKYATVPSTRNQSSEHNTHSDHRIRASSLNRNHGDKILNNAYPSEYVLYYGKGNSSDNDFHNYAGFDKNDLYAKIAK